MHELDRATRGGVGAGVIGLGLAILAIVAGWSAGAAYDGRIASSNCVGACTSAAAAEVLVPAVQAPVIEEQAPVESQEPDGFPFISARSITVMDAACGASIYARDEHLQLPPASLTKLMTAAIATDQADINTIITSRVDGAALQDATGSTVMGLVPGMELSLRDLLYGLILPSGNDAAIAIAEGIAGSEEVFVELMNAKAESLALADTHFTNAHGLYEPGLHSSAHDMAVLGRYVMQNAELREIVRTVEWQPAWDFPAISNGNALIVRYEGADGIKIGYTEESQQTIVGSATRDGRRIIVSLMRSQDRYTDAERLFDWAFAQPSACP